MSFIYITEDKVFKSIVSESNDTKDTLKLLSVSNFTLTTDYSSPQPLKVNELLLISLNKYFNTSHIRLPSDFWEQKDTYKALRLLLTPYGMQENVDDLLNEHRKFPWLENYINHTLNNLLLFDIVT